MDFESLQAYACWVVAGALTVTALIVVAASLVHWLS
jgi:hypothetical protein